MPKKRTGGPVRSPKTRAAERANTRARPERRLHMEKAARKSSSPVTSTGMSRFGDFLLCWLGFWTFTALGLFILAGAGLAELWVENNRLRAEYDLRVRQNDELAARIAHLDSRIGALDQNPQYAEQVVRQELNLRRPGQESLAVDPAPRESVYRGRSYDPVATLANRRWFAVFLNDQHRLWLVGLGCGLLFAAFLVSLGAAARRAGR